MATKSKVIWKVARGLALLTTSFAVALAGDRITVAGSTTVKPIVDAAEQPFNSKNPGVELIVGPGGSRQGIELVAKGRVNIGMASRALATEEKEQWTDLVEYRIGMDGVVMIANASNIVANLTKEQVLNVYIGKITNWKELGGPNARIVLYTLNSKHGTLEVFMNYLGLETHESGKGAALVAAYRKKGDQTYSAVVAKAVDTHREVLAGVMTNPNAVGYVSIGQAMQVISRGARVRLLDLDGVAPTIANVQSGVYQFSRPLLLITRGAANGSVRDFMDFVLGPEGQAIVGKLDYIPAAHR